MVADLVGPTPKEKRRRTRQACTEGRLEMQLERRGHQHRAADVTERVRGSEGNTGDGRTKGDSEIVVRKNSATQGEETEPPRRTWDRVPQRKLARRCQRRPVTPKSKRRTRVASTQQESEAFLVSMNATKGVHVTAEAQGIQGIFSCTPEPHIVPFLSTHFSPVFKHFFKMGLFVRRRLLTFQNVRQSS